VQKLVADKKSEQSHAAQKNAEGHLVMAVNHLRRSPPAEAGSPQIWQTSREAVSALDPDHQHGG
jgi:hypothetical protein